MSNLISSPQFLGWVILVTFLLVVFKVLQKNVRWLPRGITGTATVARLQSGLTRLLPKSTPGRTLLIGVVVALFVLWVFGVLPAPTEWKGSWKTPTLRVLADFAWANWLPIVVVWGILAGVVAIAANTCALEKGTATALYRVFAWVMGIVFFALPPLLWLVEPGTGSTAHKVTTASCQPFVSTEVRSCVLTETAVVMTAGQPTRAGEFEFCVVKPTSSSYDSKAIGTGVFQIRSTTGAFPIQYKLMKGGEKCPEKF